MDRELPQDVFFRCNDNRVVRADGQAVFPRSTILRAEVRQRMMNREEGENNVIDASDFSYDAILTLVEYLQTTEMTVNDLNLHIVALFTCGVRYDFQCLYRICEYQLIRYLSDETLDNALKAASLGDSKILEDAILTFVISVNFVRRHDQIVAVHYFIQVGKLTQFQTYIFNNMHLIFSVFRELFLSYPPVFPPAIQGR
ncbi:hypothetical protein O6H91_02G094800 [Diphasiastrum complanatum]|uniref:Uncharacterized protein n=1 Tax=Diphasiastrum complanatum TaxID=34168 RepID=A0ACC2EIL4_DIPCM|nr:hypothetical protein O6H91_02G094800 [Diphasiastrum complanatum]